jgi:hypothetical protein
MEDRWTERVKEGGTMEDWKNGIVGARGSFPVYDPAFQFSTIPIFL